MSVEPALCYLNGEFVALESARISPLDRGFLFGDAVYEVIPVYGGTPFRLDAHLRRLTHSLEATQIPAPLDASAWAAVLARLIEAAGGGDLSIYLQISRGAPSHRDHAFPEAAEPTVFVMASPLPDTSALRKQGVAATLQEDTRWQRCDIKSVALLANVLLRQEALDQGAQEAVLVRDGRVTEGSASNVFLVRDDVLITPELEGGLLSGVTRDLVLELAAARNRPVACRRVEKEELAGANEIWLTSSTKEVIPVTRLDDRPVGDGNPGPYYRAMRAWFDEYKASYAEGRSV